MTLFLAIQITLCKTFFEKVNWFDYCNSEKEKGRIYSVVSTTRALGAFAFIDSMPFLHPLFVS